MVAYIKARPGQLNYGSGGVGSINHLGMEIFKRTTGTQMTHIPFRGGSEAVIGLTNNSIQVYLTDITAANSAVGMGKSAIIGQLGSSRSPMVPDVPAMSERGSRRSRRFPGWGWLRRSPFRRRSSRRSIATSTVSSATRNGRPARKSSAATSSPAAVDLHQGHRGQRQSVDAHRARDCRRAECKITGRSGAQDSAPPGDSERVFDEVQRTEPPRSPRLLPRRFGG